MRTFAGLAFVFSIILTPTIYKAITEYAPNQKPTFWIIYIITLSALAYLADPIKK